MTWLHWVIVLGVVVNAWAFWPVLKQVIKDLRGS